MIRVRYPSQLAISLFLELVLYWKKIKITLNCLMQLATIGLAADEDVFGVIMGGVLYDVAIVINLIIVN